MEKYIDVSQIRYCREIISDESGCMAPFFVAYKEEIEKIPIADVAPIIHAHWEVVGNRTQCSYCGETSLETNYCPNCGAKMI